LAGLKIPQPKNIEEAKEVRNSLKKRLKLTPFKGKTRIIAAADASFFNDKVLAVACLFSWPELELLDEAIQIEKVDFPYIPGYLSFREGPAVIRAIRKLKRKPDLLILDGQGIAHPHGFGLACHVGVILDIPAIGCAKSRLVGEYKEPGVEKGSFSPLRFNGKIVGAALRTRENTRVLFVSPGYKVTLKDAIRMTLSCARGTRVIEPIRCTDAKTKHLKKLSLYKPVYCKKNQ
jgi:deoxyribonuclease V